MTPRELLATHTMTLNEPRVRPRQDGAEPLGLGLRGRDSAFAQKLRDSQEERGERKSQALPGGDKGKSLAGTSPETQANTDRQTDEASDQPLVSGETSINASDEKSEQANTTTPSKNQATTSAAPEVEAGASVGPNDPSHDVAAEATEGAIKVQQADVHPATDGHAATPRETSTLEAGALVAHAPTATTARSSQRAKVEFLSSQAVLAQTRIDLASMNAASLRQARSAAESSPEDGIATPSTPQSSIAAPRESAPVTPQPTSMPREIANDGQATPRPASAAHDERTPIQTGTHAHESQADQRKPIVSEAGVTREVAKVAAPLVGAVVSLPASRDQAQSKPGDAPARGIASAQGASRGARSSPIDTLTQQARPAREQVQQAGVQQAALRGVALAFQSGGGDATVNLAPESLGRIKVHVQVREGAVEATFRTTTHEAFVALRDSQETLRSSLEAQGMQVERLVIEPPPGEPKPALPQGTSDHLAAQQQDGQQRQDASTGKDSREERPAARERFGTPGAEEELSTEPASLWTQGPARGSMVSMAGGFEWVA